MRIPYPPIFVGTVVAIALAAGGAGAGQAKAAAPAVEKHPVPVVESTLAFGARKPVRPIDVVTPIVVDKGQLDERPLPDLVLADAWRGHPVRRVPALLCLLVGRDVRVRGSGERFVLVCVRLGRLGRT